MAVFKALLAGVATYIAVNYTLMVLFQLSTSWWFALVPTLSGAVGAIVAEFCNVDSWVLKILCITVPTFVMVTYTVITWMLSGGGMSGIGIVYTYGANIIVAALAGGIVFFLARMFFQRSDKSYA